MKIALAQMEVVPGQPKKNLETMLSMIGDAKAQSVDLIAFPEMCVGGYLVGDNWNSDKYCENLMEFNEILQRASEGIAIAYGNIFLDKEINKRVKDENHHPNKDGRTRRYNAAYVFQNGKPVQRKVETDILPKGVQPKGLLPTYRFFDDERYFFGLEDQAKDFSVPLESLLQPFMIEVDGEQVPIGFETCEDLWCEDYRKDGKAQDATKVLIANGAEYIVNISSSPWTFGKNDARDNRLKFLKEDCGENFKPFFYVNCTGAQNNGKNIVTFDGGSTVYNEHADPVVLSKKMYQEELIIINTNEIPYTKVLSRISKSKIAEKHDAIVTGIRHVKNIFGKEQQSKHVIGLSGGVDSAVVAGLLVEAVGKNKVLAVNMPTQYNSEKTKGAAADIAKALGIPLIEVPVGGLAQYNMDLLAEHGLGKNSDGSVSEFGEENLTAKLRGTALLSNIAAENRALFTNNGNKLETALGYATLYGDVGGALAPIADLTKVEVFQLGHYLNERFGKEVVPTTLLPDHLFKFSKDQIQPSAELKNNQIDPMKFGYHDTLLEKFTDYRKTAPEEVLGWYLAGTMEENLGISTELIQRWGIDNPKDFVEDLEWFTRATTRSVFKRVQAPPIIITSKSSYGFDIRESMTSYEPSLAFDRMKEEVLAMDSYKRGEL